MPPEAAVVLGLHARDGSSQEIATTIPPEVHSGDRVDEGGSRVHRWLAETAAASPMGSRSMYGSSVAGSD